MEQLSERMVLSVLRAEGVFWWNPNKKNTRYMKDVLDRMVDEGKLDRLPMCSGLIKFVRPAQLKINLK